MTRTYKIIHKGELLRKLVYRFLSVVIISDNMLLKVVCNTCLNLFNF